MKFITSILCVLCAFSVSAQSFYNSQGVAKGSKETDSFGTTTYKDEHGITISTSVKDSSGKIIYKNQNGIEVGSLR